MTLAVVVQALTEFAEEMHADYIVAEPHTPEALAIVLVAIRECRAELANLYDHVERDLLSVMDEKKMVVEGVGEIEVKHATRRTKWEHETLIPAILSRLADEPGVFFDPDDGTFLPNQTVGANVARRLNECVSFGGGKVTGLRAIGLDPDEFCETDYGKAQIKLPARQLQ